MSVIAERAARRAVNWLRETYPDLFQADPAAMVACRDNANEFAVTTLVGFILFSCFLGDQTPADVKEEITRLLYGSHTIPKNCRYKWPSFEKASFLKLYDVLTKDEVTILDMIQPFDCEAAAIDSKGALVLPVTRIGKWYVTRVLSHVCWRDVDDIFWTEAVHHAHLAHALAAPLTGGV
jgi:hypothetical protein